MPSHNFSQRQSQQPVQTKTDLIETFYRKDRENSKDRYANFEQFKHEHEKKMSATAEAIENLRRLSDSIKSKIH